MRKIILGLTFALLVTAAAGAQSMVPDEIYREVDRIISEQDAPRLPAFLESHASSNWYPRLEGYLVRRSRQMVIKNELDQAQAVSLAVVDKNLDNREAVELYQSIHEAIAKRDEEATKVAEREAVAAHRQKAADVKVRQDVEKTYKAVTNPTTGKKVYLDQDFNSHYRQYSWDVMLGLANLSYVTDSDGSSLKYGLSGSASLVYQGEDFSVGADILGNVITMALTGDEGVNWSAGGILSLAGNTVSKNLFLRCGYMAFTFDSGNDDLEELTFNTPLVGIGLRDIKFGESARVESAVDWYAGHLLESGVTVALGAHLFATFVLADMHDFDIHLRMGVRDTALLLEDGLKNDATGVIAIGVGNYE